MSDYTPKPIDTSAVAVPDALRPLIERLSENTHDVWAATRLAEGWRLGPTRDDREKTHPCLVPYEALPESEKAVDRVVVENVVKAILAAGYKIERV